MTSGTELDENVRREALRKKGQEFLERAVAQASRISEPPVDSQISHTRPAPQQVVDPAMETVGVMVEGLRLYLCALIFVVSSAASLVLAKASLTYLNTPAAAVFLHMLTAVILLLLCSTFGAVELGPFTVRSLQQSVTEVVCTGIQTLCLFGLLYRESVYIVAAWVCLTPQLFKIFFAALMDKSRPRALQVLLLFLGSVMMACALYVGLDRGTLSILFLLAWAGGEGAKDYVQRVLAGQDLPKSSPFDDPPNKATISLYKNSLAALPCLILGFIFNEGTAMASLEPSVPVLTVLLLSCVAWGLATCTQVIIQVHTNRGFHLLMISLSYLGILVAQVAAMGVGSVSMLLLSLAAVLVSTCLLWMAA